ncbi:carbonic anhydrase 9 isoform X3 [Phasianus colchicus]|uniref:carbonic anhydrase 9 isoform X3 n=1 Tax=Phasianus colchicus TaxID=9054 RepID=UPI00129E68A8|nr:carbonic anhydrase 9 isoform X3 [Phasianus colchicus]
MYVRQSRPAGSRGPSRTPHLLEMNRTALRICVLLLAGLGRAAAGQEHDHNDENAPHSQERGPSDSHWSYEDPGQWAKHFPACAGNMQSPININTETTIFSPQLRPIQLSGYSLPASQMLALKNNGHTVVLKLPESLAIAGGYAQQYRAVQLHLHWGSPSEPGSEHTVDHKRFAGELHVVHYNTKYENFKAAVTQPDGLAVLGVFLEVGPRENPYYQQILEHLHSIQGEDDEVFVPGFNIAGLLPDNLHLYFHYNGSLTTPPCHESVKWTVFNQTVMLSKEQMSKLVSSLQTDDNRLLMNNFRQDQSLHRRWVLASFEPSSSRERQVPAGGGTSATAAGHTSSFHAGKHAGCWLCVSCHQPGTISPPVNLVSFLGSQGMCWLCFLGCSLPSRCWLSCSTSTRTAARMHGWTHPLNPRSSTQRPQPRTPPEPLPLSWGRTSCSCMDCSPGTAPSLRGYFCYKKDKIIKKKKKTTIKAFCSASHLLQRKHQPPSMHTAELQSKQCRAPCTVPPCPTSLWDFFLLLFVQSVRKTLQCCEEMQR